MIHQKKSAHSPRRVRGAVPANRAALVAAALVLLFIAGIAPAAANQQAVYDCSAQSEIPVAECQALVDLYMATGGGDWDRNSGWLDTQTPCSWEGIDCDGGHVFILELNNNHMVTPNGGGLPASLANLGSSIILDFTENQIGGPIPAELGGLPALLVLSLGSNQLTGEIPSQLGDLDTLETLDLGDNKLEGTIPVSLGNLDSLTTLFLDSNQLRGSVPEAVCSLSPISATISHNMLDVIETPSTCDTTFTGWQETQTVPPTNIAVSAISLSAGADTVTAGVRLTWTPIAYVADDGGYNVYTRPSQNPDGPVEMRGSTGNKAASSLDITVPDDPTNFVYFIRTVTESHANNQSTLTSVSSSKKEVGAVAVNVVGVSAASPQLLIPAVAPLALLLITVAAAFVFKRR